MSRFHDAFARALFAPADDADASVADLAAQPAFAVYRNTVMKGCIDALEANFPAVARLVGRDWFRAAAAQYVRTHPPIDGSLLTYGDADFAAFLQSLPSAAELAYLGGVALLDSFWRAAHVAADAPVLDAAALAADTPAALAARVLRPHPATRWAWFDAAPVASIWSCNRTGEEARLRELAWQGEGLLLTREQGAVRWEPLSRGGCALLDASARGFALGEAAEEALHIDRAADLASLLQQLLRAGAFASSATTLQGAHP